MHMEHHPFGMLSSSDPTPPCTIFTGSMEHAQRTPLSIMCIEPLKHIQGTEFHFSLRPDEVQVLVG